MNDWQFKVLKARLTRSEGRRNKPYLDSAVPPKITIGVGFNLTDVGLYDEEIDFILANRLRIAEEGASSLPVYSKLNKERQTVLIDMVFNMGLETVKTFKTTLMHLSMGKFPEASISMLQSKWATQVGQRAIELAEIIKSGQIKNAPPMVD